VGKVKEIYKLGLKHGMKLAAIAGVNGAFTDEDIARVVELAKKARKNWKAGSAPKAAAKKGARKAVKKAAPLKLVAPAKAPAAAKKPAKAAPTKTAPKKTAPQKTVAKAPAVKSPSRRKTPIAA